MAMTDNNLRVPDDLLDEARRMAEAEGCTADEVAADALKHYIETRRNVKDLQDLASWRGASRTSTGVQAIRR